jgi:activator of HSP90 ATPase
MEKIKLSIRLPVKPKEVFKAWLNSKEHSLFTGSAAKISDKVGEEFTAWDGYISGTNIEFSEGEKIIQSWRTTDFSNNAADSLLELYFTEKHGKTVLTIEHSNIPKGDGSKYKDGWRNYYFKPMKKYFSGK